MNAGKTRQNCDLGYLYTVRKERGKWLATERRVKNGRYGPLGVTEVAVEDRWDGAQMAVDRMRSRRRFSAIIGFRA